MRPKAPFVLCFSDRLRRRQGGQGMVEYGLILVFIAIVAIIAVTAVGQRTSNALSAVSNSLNGKPGSTGAPLIVLSATLSGSVDFASTPSTPTPIVGLSETVAASATARTVLVSVGLEARPTNYRPCVLLDSSVVTTGAEPPSDSDHVSWADMGGVPVIIPGDGATHQIEACVDEAWGSNSETTILSGSYLSVADPGNRVATVQGTILSDGVDFTSTLSSTTAITGLSETVAGSQTARTVLVNVGLRADPTSYRPCVLLDNVGVMDGAGPWSGPDGVSWADMGDVPVVIPAGSQSHKISACVEAQGHQNETTILPGSYLSVADPGTGGFTVHDTSLSGAVDFPSTSSDLPGTAISGLSETIPATSTSRTVLVSVGLRANPTHYRPCVLLDGSLVTAGAGPWSDSDPVSWGDMAGIPVVIPAGSQSHKISACVQAQGSTDETTILAGYLSVVDPS